MRTEQQIRKRLRQLMYRAYQKRARRELRVVPENCAFNRETSSEFPDGTPFRVCGLALEQEPRQVLECNDPEQATSCRAFIHRTDKQAVKQALEDEIYDPEIGRREHPEIVALLWALDEDEDGRQVTFEELTLWQRVVDWFRWRAHRSAQ